MNERPVECDHEQAPPNPLDGDRIDCARCGYSAEFVVLDDGLPGEWVDTTPSPSPDPHTPKRGTP